MLAPVKYASLVMDMPQLNNSNNEVSSQLNGTDRFNWTGGINKDATTLFY